MEKLIAYAICFAFILFGVKESINLLKDHRDIKFPINRTLYYLSILLSFLIINSNLNVILADIIKISYNYFAFSSIKNEVIRMVLLVVVYFIIHFIIYMVLKFLAKLFYFGKILNRRILIFISALLGAIKGSIVILIMFIGIVIFNMTIGRNFPMNIFTNISGYKMIYDTISQNFTSSNEKITYSDEENYMPTSNVLIYYNGVTLEDGVRSNSEIDNKAIEITKYKENDLEKAKSLYVWIGSNIEYDFDKAYKTLNNESSGKSGATEAWTTQKGICFDYACLYVAMARAIDLKVRLVTGSAYDGTQYGPHAWNEVYLESEDKWIPVDPTFYMSGNYFNNNNFYDDHIKEMIAGEW